MVNDILNGSNCDNKVWQGGQGETNCHCGPCSPGLLTRSTRKDTTPSRRAKTLSPHDSRQARPGSRLEGAHAGATTAKASPCHESVTDCHDGTSPDNKRRS